MTLRPLKCLLHTVMVHVLGSSLSPLVRLYVHIAEIWWLHDIEHIIIHDLFINTRRKHLETFFVLHYYSVVPVDVELNV